MFKYVFLAFMMPSVALSQSVCSEFANMSANIVEARDLGMNSAILKNSVISASAGVDPIMTETAIKIIDLVYTLKDTSAAEIHATVYAMCVNSGLE